jgi:hypothetical protein
MLRILLSACLIAFVVSCAHKDAGKGFLKVSGRGHEGQNSALSTEKIADSTFYVGYVDYFPETREFYTSLFYREGHEYPDDDLLESKLDSVIVLDEEWGRERLPLAEARQLLMLSGLDTLAIFNRAQELVCRCPLARVEYLWDGMESYFIAVFQADAEFPGQTEELYGISANLPPEHFQKISAREISDPRFDEYLIRKLNMSRAQSWSMRHYRVDPADATYSVISSYSMESSKSRSYLAFSADNQTEILNEELDNYHYLNILPLPVHMNGKPLLLVSAGYPSSDLMWDYLAGFDGARYQVMDYNRVHLRDLTAVAPLLSDAAGR